MKKVPFHLILLVCTFALLVSCGSQPPSATPEKALPEKQAVALTVWGAEEDEELLQEIFTSFRDHYAGEADLQITYQAQSESNCKDVLLGDLEKGADVFAFADDQVAALAAAGGLDPIPDDGAIRTSTLPAAVDAASVGGDPLRLSLDGG